ncbi:MAG: elongation factor Ts [Microgenomates group bacterium]|nr:elongation factor Ts [Microgenomates group bacterium]
MVDIVKLKKLREMTGVSFALCKKALEESRNNLEKAKKKLTDWGAETAGKKSERATGQGAIFSYVHHNRKVASLIELLCETDFVATNQDFINLGHELAMQVCSMAAKDVDELLKQEYIRDPAKKIADLVNDAILKFGENIKINRFIRWNLS